MLISGKIITFFWSLLLGENVQRKDLFLLGWSWWSVFTHSRPCDFDNAQVPTNLWVCNVNENEKVHEKVNVHEHASVKKHEYVNVFAHV